MTLTPTPPDPASESKYSGTRAFRLDNIQTFNDFYERGDVDASDPEPAATAKWDPELTKRLMGLIRPVIKQQALDDLAAQRRFPVIG